MSKKIRNFIMLTILPPVVALFLALLRITLRIEHINQGPIRDAWAKGTNFIVCFWHGRLLMMPFAKQNGGGKVLVSRHRDGELITRIIHFFKLGTVRGSYQKKSVSSLREIIHELKAGIDIAITPDGPKGPRYKVKSGIIELARLSGKAIVPVVYSAGKKKLFIHGTVLSSLTRFQKLFFSGESQSLLATA